MRAGSAADGCARVCADHVLTAPWYDPLLLRISKTRAHRDGVDGDMRLHAKVPLGALLGLMNLGVTFAFDAQVQGSMPNAIPRTWGGCAPIL